MYRDCSMLAKTLCTNSDNNTIPCKYDKIMMSLFNPLVAEHDYGTHPTVSIYVNIATLEDAVFKLKIVLLFGI